MTPQQMQAWQARMGVREGHEWDPLEAVPDPAAFRAFLDNVPFFETTSRRLDDLPVPVADFELPASGHISTQAGFGEILDAIAKSDTELATRILTTGPGCVGGTSGKSWAGYGLTAVNYWPLRRLRPGRLVS